MFRKAIAAAALASMAVVGVAVPAQARHHDGGWGVAMAIMAAVMIAVDTAITAITVAAADIIAAGIAAILAAARVPSSARSVAVLPVMRSPGRVTAR